MAVWHHISTAGIFLRTEIILYFIQINEEKKNTTRPVKATFFCQICREEVTILCMFEYELTGSICNFVIAQSLTATGYRLED
jgi:hypothetical protein